MKAPRILIALLIISFIILSILGESSGIRTYSIFLAAVSSCSLTLIIVTHRRLAFPKVASMCFLLFIGWMLISSFFSKDISQTIWEILRTVSYFGLFLTVYALVKNNKSIQRFLLISFITVGSILLIRDLYNFFSWGYLSSGRYLIGSFYWHNQMAGFIVILIPLLLSLFLLIKNLYLKFVLLSAILISLIAIVFTYSRGGWLSLIASLLLFLALSFKKIKSHIKPLFIMFVIFLISMVVVIKPANIGRKIESIKTELSSQTRSVSGNLRITVWQNTFKMIKDNPIFGVGPGVFGESYYKYQNVPWLYAKNAHNHYLEYVAELGIVGFFLFAAITINAIFMVLAERKVLGDFAKYPLLIGVIAALFGSAFHALVDIDWSRISLYSIYWILLAILFANLTRKEKKIDVVGIKKLIYLFPCILLVASILLLVSERNYSLAEKKLSDHNILEAEKNIVVAITFNPYDSSSYLVYGQIKEIQKKQDAAKEIYYKVASLSSYNSEPYYRLGQIEFVNKNYTKAKEMFIKAIELAPFSHPKLYVALSDTYNELGETNKAKNTLRNAIENIFPLNESFREFSYMYEYSGLNKHLANLYLEFIAMDIQNNKIKEAKRLLGVVEKDLDPKNPIIPHFKTLVVQ